VSAAKKTTVALLGSFPPLRGISSYCLEMATAMARRANVKFISFKHMYPRFLYPGGDLQDDLSFPGISIESLNVYRRLSWFNPISWIHEGLFTQADLLHAQWWSIPLAPIYCVIAGLFKLRRKPVVFTVHNVLNHERSGLFRIVSKTLFKFGDHFIVHTNQNRQQIALIYGIPIKQISVIPHGSLDFQVNCNADRLHIRKTLEIDQSDKVILLFGAIRPYKGLTTAIRAFARVRKAIPEAKLLIVGKLWEDWTPYQKLIDQYELGDFIKTYLHYIPSAEVHQYFCAADLTILPYRHFDSQSGVGSAAVAFRLPMVVSNVGGLPDLVTDQRCVVPPDNPDELAQAVTFLLSNALFLEQITANMKLLSERFNWKKIAKATCDVYQTVQTETRRRDRSKGRV
jgi:glycosyltransferase involved in cell wall biosynthesis